MNTSPRFLAKRPSRRSASHKSHSPRKLALQQLEPRQLLAGIGDWAAIDLREILADDTTDFKDLSGVVFHGNQLAVTANVLPDGAAVQARLVLVDVNLDAHTATVGTNSVIPSLSPGGATEALAVNSNGSVVYMTGYSVSSAAPEYGEAFRATWDGTQILTNGLGYIYGKNSIVDPVDRSIGIAVNSSGVVAGSSDAGRAIFEYDQEMEYAGDLDNGGVIYGISEDGVKAGIDVTGVVWEADKTRRDMTDPYGDGVYVFGISPDHSRVPGSGLIFGVGGFSIEKLLWWNYDGTPNVVLDGQGNPIDGRLTSATNADVGYLVGRSNPPSDGDLLHMESTNQTLKIVDWFESISGMEIPAETSEWGPEIAYDYDSGQVAIISGGYLYTVKIWDDNPVAHGDDYRTPANDVETGHVELDVAAPGVLGNDTDDGVGPLLAMLVAGPKHGTLTLYADGSFLYSPELGYNREDTFTYKASDGDYESSVVTVNITMDTQFPWHNGLMPLDVNDSGLITPVDALEIINVLNAGGGSGDGSLPTQRPRPLAAPFYDTSPNNVLSPLDALIVINFLNGMGGADGEGKADNLASDSVDSLAYDSLDSTPTVSTTILVTGLMDVSSALLAEGEQEPTTAQRTSPANALIVGMAGPQIGCDSSKLSATDEIWAELESQGGLVDLEELLSAMLGADMDEA